ncbi:MAG TPA: hypothetical protein VFF65_04065 [Phycisphaerales bacterium]|nr:hypothetical protein [Phycisphaerales bacterium]
MGKVEADVVARYGRNRSAANWNNFAAALVASTFGRDNFAEEGLVRRCFSTSACVEKAFTPLQANGGTQVLAAGGVWATINHGVAYTQAVTIPANAALLCWLDLSFERQGATLGIPIGLTVETRWTVGGVGVTGTLCRVGNAGTVPGHDFGTWLYYENTTGANLAITAAAEIRESSGAGGTVRMGTDTLFGRFIRRVT